MGSGRKVAEPTMDRRSQTRPVLTVRQDRESRVSKVLGMLCNAVDKLIGVLFPAKHGNQQLDRLAAGCTSGPDDNLQKALINAFGRYHGCSAWKTISIFQLVTLLLQPVGAKAKGFVGVSFLHVSAGPISSLINNRPASQPVSCLTRKSILQSLCT